MAASHRVATEANNQDLTVDRLSNTVATTKVAMAAVQVALKVATAAAQAVPEAPVATDNHRADTASPKVVVTEVATGGRPHHSRIIWT